MRLELTRVGLLAELANHYTTRGAWWNKRIHIFLYGMSSKGNMISRLEFEHAYYDVAVQHFCHYAKGNSSTTTNCKEEKEIKWSNKDQSKITKKFSLMTITSTNTTSGWKVAAEIIWKKD